jgi:hypothetical protein
MTWSPIGSPPSSPPALVDGVPVWLRRGTRDWLKKHLHGDSYHLNSTRKTKLVQEFDQLTRSPKPLAAVFEDDGFGYLEEALFTRQDANNLYIQFLDFMVSRLYSTYNGTIYTAALDELLRNGGSKWKVGRRNVLAGLEERVPQGVATAAESTMSNSGLAGTLLSDGWLAAFGVSPDYEKAYSKAVKAVEACAIPIVSPKNVKASLGTVIADLRNQASWSLDMTREHPDATTHDVVVAMMQSLWTGQNDRHAGHAGYTPSTRREAEAALLLAVPLVQWFTSGAIARRA